VKYITDTGQADVIRSFLLERRRGSVSFFAPGYFFFFLFFLFFSLDLIFILFDVENVRFPFYLPNGAESDVESSQEPL